MYQHRIRILFYLNRVRTNKKGLCPVRCRITYRGTRKEFSTGQFINPRYWDSTRQRLKAEAQHAEITNLAIGTIEKEILERWVTLPVTDGEFDLSSLLPRSKQREPRSEWRLLQFIEHYNRRKEHLIGIEISKGTWQKYKLLEELLEGMLKSRYKKSDILLKDLKMSFLDEWQYYLKTEVKYQQSTLNKAVQRFRTVISQAISEGVLNSDPFIRYKAPRLHKKIKYLTYEELQVLAKHPFQESHLSRDRDLFVLCCYTGLAYKEMEALRLEHLHKDLDGISWIRMERQKTSSQVLVPLLRQALDLLERFGFYEAGKLPVVSNQKLNKNLKEICAAAGISKSITHHMARKTFATSVLLYHKVPMEIVSKLLGHSNIRITQGHYAKIVDASLKDAFIKLQKQLYNP